MTLRFLRATAVAIAVVACGSSGWAQTGGEPPGGTAAEDPVVARVNGAAILRSDVAAARQLLPERFRAMPVEALFPILVGQLIDSRLMAAEAHRSGLNKDPEVRRRIAMLEVRVLEQAYIESVIVAEVTDEALRKRYEGFARTARGTEQVRARHILVKTRAEAVAIIAELGKPGADFAALARERSTGPSGANGGDLGYFSRSDMVTPFADAAFTMKPGEISNQPVKTRFGWHVIKVEDRRAAGTPSFEESAAELRNEMIREILKRRLAALRDGARIERYNLDGTPRAAPEGAPPASSIRPAP